jgi:cytoskeletal protein CcmA (bactofilin family)
MFNVRRNRDTKEATSDKGGNLPALDVETAEENTVDTPQRTDDNVSLLRREDLQQPKRPGEGGALLGRGCRFDGKLTFEGTVQIDGEFLGTIDSPGHLIVSDGARIDGTVNVASAVISGTVKGKITTSGTLELHSTARVDGELVVEALVIERGAHFQGDVKMSGSA